MQNADQLLHTPVRTVAQFQYIRLVYRFADQWDLKNRPEMGYL